ncbi:MAG: hypothetical protein ACREH8_20140 [Opitutaceae bacterium]
MPKHLFTEFLRDPEEYRGAQNFWHELCYSALHPAAARSWQPWLSHIDGGDDRSATIFSLWDETAHKGICIEQMGPASSEIQVGARMDVFGLNHLEQPVDFMVIWCELSKESAAVARRLIEAWSDPRMTRAEMSKAIDKIVG